MNSTTFSNRLNGTNKKSKEHDNNERYPKHRFTARN